MAVYIFTCSFIILIAEFSAVEYYFVLSGECRLDFIFIFIFLTYWYNTKIILSKIRFAY